MVVQVRCKLLNQKDMGEIIIRSVRKAGREAYLP